MKSSELRIGNLVNWDTVDKPSYFEVSLYQYLDRLKPIPLTEEWLLRFGFEFDVNNRLWELKDTFQFTLEFQNKYVAWNSLIYVNSYCHHTLPKYVHQLQNLYFALTGKELEINS